jgi:tRNA pseudouridine13 synthase
VPWAHGSPPATGLIRATADDFRVEEILGFEADGAGTHVLLGVEKRDANTGWVAAQLARQAGVAVRDVGFSGHKDRHAVTRQAFSLPISLEADVNACLEWQGEGYRVLSARRHGRKLRPGSHRANRFELIVRDMQGERSSIEARLQTIATQGVPNYFGPQRFGRDAGNLERALDWANGGAGPRDRGQRSFVLSATRSYLFNAVLAERVRQGNWDRPLAGEAVMLDGKRSYFRVDEVDPALLARVRDFDVHPTGPLPGRGASAASAEALRVEHEALAPHAALVDLLARERLEHERRSLRLPVRDLAWQHADGGLTLTFTLPRGTFATAVLHEVIGNAWDATEAGED